MFDRGKIRYWIAGVWLLAFMLIWVIFDEAMLPRQQMKQQIQSLEKSIIADDWFQAKREMQLLDETWYKNKLFIQVSSGSDEVFTFEQLLGQANALIMAQDKNALEFVSGMKIMNHYVSEAFPGP